ncbi:MAG: AMP-dependent synthetase/ligase [Syntrophales bacterium]
MFMHQAGRFGNRVLKLTKKDNRWVPTTWREARENLRRVSMGLVAFGIEKGDRVGIVSQTRGEWSDADLAILTVGAVTVGIYPTASAREQQHVIGHSGCRLLFVENDSLLDRILTIRETLGLPEQVVVFDTTRADLPAAVATFADLKRQGHALDMNEPTRFDALWRAVEPADLATIAYTSGTSGPPKGAMITHANLFFTAINAAKTQDLAPDDFGIAYLPLTHMLQRMTVYAALHAGIRGVYAESIDKLSANFRELKPTVQVGVPRIFEKIHARIIERLNAGTALKRRIFGWAMEVGRRAATFRMAGTPLPLALTISHALADRIVFAKIRAIFGGRVRRLVSGGAPMPRELLDFFFTAGLPILEGYGLTETVAPVSVNRPDRYRFGTVGTLIDGIEAKLADDNELLLRGRGLFQGYYRDPEATARAIDPDGWFHTGDIAAIDAEGFITITDRKKEIIVTAGGKNIAPQNLESLLRVHPLISQAMVTGDGRPYLSALITLDRAAAAAFASREKIPAGEPESLAGHPRLRALVEKHVAAVNARLAPYEQIKRFAILSRDFTEEAGEITPTLKIRRKEITRTYRDLIDTLYQ